MMFLECSNGFLDIIRHLTSAQRQPFISHYWFLQHIIYSFVEIQVGECLQLIDQSIHKNDLQNGLFPHDTEIIIQNVANFFFFFCFSHKTTDCVPLMQISEIYLVCQLCQTSICCSCSSFSIIRVCYVHEYVQNVQTHIGAYIFLHVQLLSMVYLRNFEHVSRFCCMWITLQKDMCIVVAHRETGFNEFLCFLNITMHRKYESSQQPAICKSTKMRNWENV